MAAGGVCRRPLSGRGAVAAEWEGAVAAERGMRNVRRLRLPDR